MGDLSTEAYQRIYDMLTSDDETQRARGQKLSGKLDADQAQKFFDFQHAANPVDAERNRQDNSLGGMPPELAATSILGVGGAMMRAGASGASKMAAGAKAAVGMATPVVKEEMTRRALESMGLPSSIATPIATLVAMHGLRGSKTATAVESAEPAAVEAAAAAPKPVAPAAAVAEADAVPVAAKVTKMPAPKAFNEVAIAARRAKIKLTAADELALAREVSAGAEASEAIARMAATKQSPLEALMQSDSFKNLPTTEEAEAMIDARHARGEIKTPSASMMKKMGWK